jgi:hypothetical protein
MKTAVAALALAAALVPLSLFAQDPPTGVGQEAQTGGGRGGAAREPEIRPYDRVITKDAKSDEGIFTVHRIKDRLYYEIPKDKLGQRHEPGARLERAACGREAGKTGGAMTVSRNQKSEFRISVGGQQSKPHVKAGCRRYQAASAASGE